MRKKTHIKMLMFGFFGLFLTFRKQIHDLTRIDHEDKEELQLERLREKYIRTQVSEKSKQKSDKIY